jgi:two-component system nitrate/nitrite response regulator NarL
LSSMFNYSSEISADEGSKNKEFMSESEIRPAPRLSERQKTILRCLIEGDANKVIARKNNIAEATVKVHVKAILREIGVGNRTQAAMWAMRNEALMGSIRESEAARPAIVAEPSLQRHAVAAPSGTRADPTAPPLDPSKHPIAATEGERRGTARRPVAPSPGGEPNAERKK